MCCTLLGALADNAHADQCAITGEHVRLERVVVRPKGAKPFVVGLRDVRARATLPSSPTAPVAIEVAGVLAFTAYRHNLWLTVTGDYQTEDGRVRLRRGAQVVQARAAGDAAIAAAVLHADDVLEGEDKEPHELVSPVRIPCRLLSLGSVQVDDHAHEDVEQPGATWWEPRRASAQGVKLWPQPNLKGTPLVVRAPHCQGPCIYVKDLQGAQGGASPKGWMLVERRGEGVAVTGWMRRSELKRIPEEAGLGRADGCSNAHAGGGSWGESWGPSGPPPNLYEGPATVMPRTPVFSAPPKGEWAVFTAETSVGIQHTPGEAWVRLRAIPGLDGWPTGSPWLNAFVARNRVVLPSAQEPPAPAP